MIDSEQSLAKQRLDHSAIGPLLLSMVTSKVRVRMIGQLLKKDA